VKRSADISACGRYRYVLTRRWDDATAPMLVIGLNPSTADAHIDDPPIRRCIAFARRESAGGLVMLNLFALRSTDPQALAVAADPIGAGNDHILSEFAAEARRTGTGVVCAWGNGGRLLSRSRCVVARLLAQGAQLLHFGLTNAGEPKHPLYLHRRTPLQQMPPRTRP
jgi:hypothetical protein